MLSKEEMEKIAKILSCDNCLTSYACEACNITWTDKNLIKKYISELEISNKGLDQENNRLEKIELERDKQNKIINEMALAISSYDIDEEICKNLATPFCNNEPLRVTADVCARCVKQYFEEKVEEK